MSHHKIIWLILLIITQLSACGALSNVSKYAQLPSKTINNTTVTEKWHAPLPHDGDVANLKTFWGQYDDATLLNIIEAAQKASVSIASAKARIAEAKSNRVAIGANTLPNVDGSISATRAVQQPEFSGEQSQFGGFGLQGATNTYQVGVQAAWEIDLFGSNKVLLNAADKQLLATDASWHEARVSVAAEAATAYFNQRFCRLQQDVLTQEVQSLDESLRITKAAIGAGFLPAASGDLASASLANAKIQLNTQQAVCDVSIKELVAMTALSEEDVREQLTSTAFETSVAEERFAIDEVPASVIQQRPDVYSAEAALVSAAATITKNTVAKYPRISLNGSIGWMWLTGTGYKTDGKVWSLGPVSITLPLYDGGKRQAKLLASEVAYEESAQQYRNTVRNAVKEVEVALVNLQSSKTKQSDLDIAVEGYQSALKATEVKVSAGFANLIELEESRRFALQAELNRLNVQQARYNAWISLYRAVGGDWHSASHVDLISQE